jgi:hypothetical protein
MILKVPTGPVAPIIEALAENEVFAGWVSSMEESSAKQFVNLQESPTVTEDENGRSISYHGLDGQMWALDHLFGEHFPAMQRASAFLTIWGSLERQMTKLCHEITKAGGHRISLGDLEGKGLHRARTFLLKVASLDGAWAQEHWQEMPHFMNIRNLFAHGDGHIDPAKTKFIEYINSSSHMNLDGEMLRLRSTFLPFYLGKERSLLLSLEQVVVQRFGKAT